MVRGEDPCWFALWRSGDVLTQIPSSRTPSSGDGPWFRTEVEDIGVGYTGPHCGLGVTGVGILPLVVAVD